MATKKVSRAKAAQPALSFIDLDKIKTLPQVRTEFNPESIDELAKSLKQHGMLQPVLLRPDGDYFVVIAGERRLRAAELAGLKAVPALVGDVAEDHAVEMQLVENIQREELSLADTAAGVLRLYERHQSLKAVAAIVQKSLPWCSKYLAAATKLSYEAAWMLTQGMTEDLDLVLTMNQIQQTGKWYPRGSALRDKIQDGQAGRKEARALLAQIREEIEQEKADKKAAKKAGAQQPGLDLDGQAGPKEPPPWDADDELDTLHDLVLQPDHPPVDKLLEALTREQLAAMADVVKSAWDAGKKSAKGTEVQKMRAFWRYLDVGCDTMQSAAFILGASSVKLNVHDLLKELHHLMHV
jgi:ParB/RepB/Spo0J family partition protein